MRHYKNRIKIKRNLTILSLVLISSIAIFSQSLKVDSLENVFAEMPNDSVKVDSLNEAFKHLYREDRKSALKFARQALEVGQNIDYKKGIARGLHNVGVIYYLQSNTDSSLYYLNSAHKVFQGTDDSLGYAKVCGLLGTLNDDIGKPEIADEYLSEALTIFRALKDEDGIAKTLNNMGGMYKKLGKYSEALTLYKESLRLKRKNQDTLEIAGNFLNIGDLYRRQGEPDSAYMYIDSSKVMFTQLKSDIRMLAALNLQATIQSNFFEDYEKARSLFEESLDIAKRIENKGWQARMLTNISNTYLNQNNYEEAEEIMLQSLQMKKDVKDREGIASAYYSLAKISLETDQIDKAIVFGDQSLNGYKSLSNTQGMARAYEVLGLSYYKKDEYHKAINYLEKGQKIAMETGIKLEEYSLAKALADSYSAIGNYQKAFAHQKQVIHLNEEIFTGEKTKIIAEADAKFGLEEKDKIAAQNEANYQAEQNLRKKNVIWLLAIIIISMIIGIATFVIVRTQRNKALKKVAKLFGEKEKLEDKLEDVDYYDIIPNKIYQLKGSNKQIRYGDIVYITTDPENSGYAKFYTVDDMEGRKYLENNTLTSVLASLEEAPFFVRIRKSTIINKNYIKQRNSKRVELTYSEINKESGKLEPITFTIGRKFKID